MRILDETYLAEQTSGRLQPGETFQFRCHPQVSCFNHCCRNLNLFLYPYDVLRLKNALRISSDAFLDAHVDVVLRPDSYFPEVLLRMAANAEQTCPFLTPQGCRVYADRPDACRTFPLEQGIYYDAARRSSQAVYFYRPPDFCMGQHETMVWTPQSWLADQEAEVYTRMTIRWGELRRKFDRNTWGPEGPEGAKAKMVFMSAFNLDRLRAFIFQSSFLKRYQLKNKVVKAIQKDDRQLLQVGMEWIELFLYGKETDRLRNRRLG